MLQRGISFISNWERIALVSESALPSAWFLNLHVTDLPIVTAIERFTGESQFLAMLTNPCHRAHIDFATCSSCCSLFSSSTLFFYPFVLSSSSSTFLFPCPSLSHLQQKSLLSFPFSFSLSASVPQREKLFYFSVFRNAVYQFRNTK